MYICRVNSKIHLLEGATRLFMRYGIKSVTMDAVAQELGISKKTIYQHFEDKRDLVFQAVSHHFQQEQNFCSVELSEIDHPIEQMMAMTKRVYNHLKETNPALVYDIRRYYPRSWEVFRTHRNGFILGFIEKNLETGITQGWYRESLKPSIDARLYIQLMDGIASPELFPFELSDVSEIVKQLVRYHLYSICSHAGSAYLAQNHPDL